GGGVDGGMRRGREYRQQGRHGDDARRVHLAPFDPPRVRTRFSCCGDLTPQPSRASSEIACWLTGEPAGLAAVYAALAAIAARRSATRLPLHAGPGVWVSP